MDLSYPAALSFIKSNFARTDLECWKHGFGIRHQRIVIANLNCYDVGNFLCRKQGTPALRCRHRTAFDWPGAGVTLIGFFIKCLFVLGLKAFLTDVDFGAFWPFSLYRMRVLTKR